LSSGDDFIFTGKLGGHLAKGLLDFENAGMEFAAKAKIPVFCDLFRQGEAVSPSRRSPLAIADRS